MMTNEEFLNFYFQYVTDLKKRKLNMDLGVRCPMKCPFCQRQHHGKQFAIKNKLKNSKDLNIDNLKKIIKYFKNLHFCGQISDPMYNKNIFEILQYLKSSNIKTLRIATVANKDEDWWREIYSIAPAQTHWIFGMDGCDQETLEKYRIGANFNSLWNAMKIGVEEFNAIVEWQFIIFRHNEHQIELAHQMAKDNGIHLQIYKSPRWWDQGKNMIYPPSDEWMVKSGWVGDKKIYHYGKRIPLSN
jgi:MoaA/NifB/PqqE/SkfB family radical SAM enzyme